MSKSKGNVAYTQDLLSQGFLPPQIRFFLLYGLYRDELDLRLSSLDQRAGYLNRIRRLTRSLMERETEEARGTDTDLAVQGNVSAGAPDQAKCALPYPGTGTGIGF
ncbi:MAG: hypothetical protein ACODAD_13685 [Planctomycetota bacterium]